MDCFAVLGEERRPWIDPGALKAKFLRLAAEVHPDRTREATETALADAGSTYADLNSAHQTLRESRRRLPHLIELESGERPRDIQRIPPGTMDLFVEVGQACRDVDAFLAQRRETGSPMLKVRLFQEGLEWVGKLKTLQETVNQKAATLDEELRALNAVWDAAPPVGSPVRREGLPLPRLEEIYRILSYVARWTEQIQERLVQLASP